jgi:hypothetical protein
MSKFYVGQTILSKNDNKRCIVEYTYDQKEGEDREYRVTFDVDKKMKILRESDLALIPNTYSSSEVRHFSFGDTEKEYIRKYKIYYLFHFTHRNNLGEILSTGLLPKNRLVKDRYTSIADEEVQVIRAGVNFYLYGKINKPIHDCVPLYISWRTPTLYKVLHKGTIEPRDIIYILVNTYSILRKNYCFTDGNAASIHTKQYVLLNNLDKLDWSVIKSDEWGGDNERIRKKNAEFLVFPKIDVRDIYKLIVFDNDIKQEVQNAIRSRNLSLEVDVDTRYYEWPKMF